MAVVGNIEETTAAVVLDTRMWAGTEPSSTAWLSGIAGVSAGNAEGGLNLLVVDVVVDSAAASTTINLATTNITGVNGSTAYAILGVENRSGGLELPTAAYVLAGVPTFVTAAGTAGDTHRLTILYA